jgi:hypothetical protein
MAALSGCLLAACRQEPAGSHPAPAASSAPAKGRSLLRSPLDAKDTAGAKQRLVELLRRQLNERLGVTQRQGQWDFWSEGSSRFVLPSGERAYLMSFRRFLRTGQQGYLVITSIAGQNAAVYGHWQVPAGIDDIHVMDVGKAGRMIYTVAFDTTGNHRRIYHNLLRYDGRTLTSVWSYRLSYNVNRPRSHKPVSVTFRDEDGDGNREVRIRIPGKDTPHLWKRRWALFHWDAPSNAFVPLRNLAFTPVALQKPRWAAFGFLEAAQSRSERDARRFGALRSGCRHIDDLYDAVVRRRYRLAGRIRYKAPADPYRSRRARVTAPLTRPKDVHRYLAEFSLVREGRGENGWRVCAIRFFRL